MPRTRWPLALGTLFLAAPMAARSQVDSGVTVPIAPLTRVPGASWGVSVWVIDSAEIASSTAQTFSELLQARRPGVRVLRSGGMVNDGSFVMLRGPTSISATNEPIVIVDGVRVDSRQYDFPIGAYTSVAPSRLDDLLPEDIERIEVLSGAAAALYGEGAANGVLLVSTKSGGTGPLHLSGRATWNPSELRDEFPANYRRIGVSPSTGQPATRCLLVDVANGQCTPTGLDIFNPLAQASPFRTGNSARAHLELGGVALGTALSAGLTGDQRQSTMPHDEASRLGLRGKLGRALPWHLKLDASGTWLRDGARIGVDGNTTANANVLGNGLLGTAENDANHGYAAGYGLPGDSIYPDDALRHATGGVALSWRPLAWLDGGVMSGRDRVTERWRLDQLGPSTASLFPELRATEEHDLRTSSARASATFKLRPRVVSVTHASLERVTLHQTYADTSMFNGALLFGFSQFRNRSTSFTLDERLAIRDDLFVSAALNRVTRSIFGANAGREWFPSANIAYQAPLRGTPVSDLRLRAAYSEAPGATSSLVTVTGTVLPPFGGPFLPAKMERTKSFEIGADATVARRTRVQLTAFSSQSTRLWVTVLNPPGGGFNSAGQNAAMRNSGVEALVAAPLMDLSEVHWTGSLSLALLRNRVTRLAGTPPIISVNGSVAQGYSFGGVWATPYTYADANQDGIIAPGELQLGPQKYVGPALPTLESAFSTDLQLVRGFTISGTFDYRQGNRVVDRTGGIRCGYGVCRATEDPTSSLADQAAALVGSSGVGFAEDGSFMRVREIAVRWSIPARFSGAIGTRADLTVAGRNLATWTHYRGLDPEVSYQNPDILPRQEFLVMPLPRELVVRLDLGQR